MTFQNLHHSARRFGASPVKRRIAYAVALFVALLLALFPRPYVSRVKILPQDSQAGAAALISALGGGVQNFAAVHGAQKTNYLVIGRSHDVQSEVIDRLGLTRRWKSSDHAAAERKLERKVDIQLLQGGVLEVTAKDSDPAFAQSLVEGFTAVIKSRLSELGLEQVRHKRDIVNNRLAEANQSLDEAALTLNNYRVNNNLPSPEAALGAAVNRRLSLDSAIRGKELEIEVSREFVTDRNIRIITLQAELAALQRQRMEADQMAVNGNAVTLSSQAAEYYRLYREQQFAEGVAVVYRRFVEEVNVEELSAGTNVQVIELPHVDPNRHYNMSGIALFLALVVLAFYTEYYMPLTRLGGSFGRRRRTESQ